MASTFQKQAITFDAYIADKIRGFTGRKFVFDAVDDFLKTYSSGYFIIRGDPGIGKSAFLAKLVADRGYVHHFNIASQNIRSSRVFLDNICRQLIDRYDLLRPNLPPNATDDSSFLTDCLNEAARNKKNLPIIIAVDALDEAERIGLPATVNSLYLPPSVPEGVFFIITVRRISDMRLNVSSHQVLDLEADSKGNLQDIHDYIEHNAQRDGIKARMVKWEVTAKEFIDGLQKKSQGNFMYLHYVLPAIEAGTFKDGGLDELPDGLLEYYQRHWRQMRESDERNFDSIFEPIVCILGVAQEPVTIDQISAWTKVEKRNTKKAIENWCEFLKDELCEDTHYFSIYHASFQEFLKDKVDLTQYDGMIADYYLRLANLK